jgi:heme exporter protein C
VLFFLYVGIYALREAIADQELRARASALIAMVGTINIPIIKYSVEWWNTLHQPASFGLTQKPAMPSEMWMPLLVMVLGFYAFAGFIVLVRMRTEILNREMGARWVRDWVQVRSER